MTIISLVLAHSLYLSSFNSEFATFRSRAHDNTHIFGYTRLLFKRKPGGNLVIKGNRDRGNLLITIIIIVVRHRATTYCSFSTQGILCDSRVTFARVRHALLIRCHSASAHRLVIIDSISIRSTVDFILRWRATAQHGPSHDAADTASRRLCHSSFSRSVAKPRHDSSSSPHIRVGSGRL